MNSPPIKQALALSEAHRQAEEALILNTINTTLKEHKDILRQIHLTMEENPDGSFRIEMKVQLSEQYPKVISKGGEHPEIVTGELFEVHELHRFTNREVSRLVGSLIELQSICKVLCRGMRGWKSKVFVMCPDN